ncbi:hypothetical protein [Mycolicibacterium wolinskyi]|uniref:hypothetical protein n=1 Tax=Mycolicibacterium wolinskyi TaxID=59750 RepID=UPI003917AC41
MKRILGVLAVSAAAAALTAPAVADAAVNTAVTSIPTPSGLLEMHATADCAGDRCRFNTQANLLGPNGPIGLPGDTWARQTITLRSTDRSVWQEASYSAPSGSPRELHKGANNNNVLSRMLKATNNVEISVTYFGGGPIERFRVDGDSQPIDWRTGQPDREADFIACTQIQIVSSGWNLTTPTACAQTNFG